MGEPASAVSRKPIFLTTNRIAKAGVLWFFSFVVPNAVAKDEYLGTVWKSFSPKHASSLDNAEKNFEKLIQDNDLKPFLNSLVEDDFQFTKWDFGGSEVFDPEASFKAVLLMCINLVRGKKATLQNEVHYNPDESAYGYFSDITLLPADPSKPGIILELKNVTVAALDPRKENWTTIIERVKTELLEKSEADLLKMTFQSPGMHQVKTIQDVRDEALAQVETYRQKAADEHKRNSGYKAWVVIRVGLFRILAFEAKT